MKVSKLQLQIANICYANVAGNFAMFTNKKYAGDNFRWDRFPTMMKNMADTWLLVHLGKKDQTSTELARKYAKEIAETLMERMQ